MYRSKLNLLPNASYAEVIAAVRREYHIIQKQNPRRQPYIRSHYFKKDKIFINQYFEHINQKNGPDRKRRLRLFSVAIEVIRNCSSAPTALQNPSMADEILYRYTALTNDGVVFAVQIRENKITKRKDFMSAFPLK